MKTKIVILLLMLSFAMSAQKNYTIPFTMDALGECSVPLAKISVDGKDKLFIIDSAASRSIIRDDFTESFKCVMNVELSLSTINGESESKIMSVYRVSLLDTFHLFTAQNINAINNAYKKYKLKQDIYGILGSDFLRAHKATIDYDKKTLTITIF